jgi:hypothetical protein
MVRNNAAISIWRYTGKNAGTVVSSKLQAKHDLYIVEIAMFWGP